jgi:hypothetical protein
VKKLRNGCEKQIDGFIVAKSIQMMTSPGYSHTGDSFIQAAGIFSPSIKVDTAINLFLENRKGRSSKLHHEGC